MPIRLTFTFLGETQVDRTLDGIVDRSTDMRPAWDVLSHSFSQMEREQFGSLGAYGGQTWSPLSPRYAAWKARHFPGKSIMQRSGDLFRSLAGAAPSIDIRELNYAIFGTDVEYAGFHQRGGGNLPQRKVIEMPDSLRRQWVKVIQRYLVTGAVGGI